MKQLNLLLLLLPPCIVLADGDSYWQQRVEYRMEIDFNVENHRFTGKQTLKYYNNSPDTITRVFYHLYFNAFQPGSMMDIRTRNLPDPDRRLVRIRDLKEDEIGYHKIGRLTQDGAKVKHQTNGTILEVQLSKPLLPGRSTVLEMDFSSQVPKQTRRSGRDNAEGISYSMSQWYPKLCAYDEDGWHPNPYIAREFYADWGDFDVYLTIDKNYTVGASGYLQNADVIGHGYEKEGTTAAPARGDKLTWHFHAPNVHDFVWAADPDYKHVKRTRADGTVMHFIYQETEQNAEAWSKLPEIMDVAFDYVNKHFGQYPYKQYSFIQGGDGGMEYPMATLITGNRSLGSLVGVSVHELLHSWYQMVLATNESLYSWMDEGFTSYATARTMNELARQGLIPGRPYRENPFSGSYRSYANFSTSGAEEALTTHSDHFNSNAAYSVAAYTKGNIFLNQLNYIIGDDAFARTMLRYYNEWKFKHPDTDDFIRVAEKTSGLMLDWYKEYWINTTHNIDYAITDVQAEGGDTRVRLSRQGVMPMPIEVQVTEKNGKTTTFYAPLGLMRGGKKAPEGQEWVVLEDWPWTHPTYDMVIPCKFKNIVKIEIDPSQRMADVAPANNVFSTKEDKS